MSVGSVVWTENIGQFPVIEKHPGLASAATGDGDGILLPSARFAVDAVYRQKGDDLVLTSGDGMTVVVPGYFLADPRPDLLTLEGGRITPSLVASFTPPEAAGQYAQAGSVAQATEPIGQVENASGGVFVTRADGTRVRLGVGDPVYQGDVVETVPGGAVNMVFLDKTTFALGDDARLALDEFVYNPATQSGSSGFSILKGVFVFASGQIAKTDNTQMTVTTPVATIGIRGTKVAGEIKPAGEESKFTVIEGSIAVSTQAGSVFMGGSNETTSVSSLTAPPSTPVILSQAEINQSYSSVSSVAPKMLTNTPQQGKDAEAEATQDDSEKGAEGEGEAGVSDADENTEDVSENGQDDTSAVSEGLIQFVSSDFNLALNRNIKIAETSPFENFKAPEFVSGRPPSTDFGGRASLPNLIIEENDAPEGAPTGEIAQVANSQTVGFEVFLQGTFIELGVSAAGTLGTLARAPDGFHASLSDGRMSTVIDLDSFGAGQDSGSTRSGDFTLPGVPIESYTIGYRDIAGGAPVLIHQNGAASLNTLNSVTVDNSFGNVLSTVTSGAAGNISMIRDISFDADQLSYAVTLIVTNISGSEIFDVRYLHNMDVDVDSNVFGNVQTKNDVLLNTGSDSSDKIAIAQAVGPESGLQINLIGIGTEYRVSNFGLNNISPYDSSAFDIPVDGNGISVDESISMAISFGNLSPGETQTKRYFVSFNSANIGSDVLVGTEGDDVLKGFAGNDVFAALAGDDTLDGGGGNDTFFSGLGNDVISGGNGEDTLSFELSKDSIVVNLEIGISRDEGNHTFSSIENVIGSDFSDIIFGSSGNNTLDGGYGADTISGSDGNDFFKYNYKDLDFISDPRTVISGDEFDFISGFEIGEDKIVLDNTFGFNEVGSPNGEVLGVGRAVRFFQNAGRVLVEGENFFVIDTPFDGTPASSPVFSGGNNLNPESVVFSTSDNTLYFDRNGSGSGYTIVAQFDDGLSAELSPSDIMIASN